MPCPSRWSAIATALALSALSALFALACGDGTTPSPTAPSTSSGFAVFTDPASGFSTTDVRDIDDQIVRFNPADQTMLWTPDNLLFDGWIVDGNFLDQAHTFEVKFGSVGGQKRAYFTEAARGTLCDLRVEQNVLQLVPTSTFPPQS